MPSSPLPGALVKKRAFLSAGLVHSKKARMKSLQTCLALGCFAFFAFFAGGSGWSDGATASSSFSWSLPDSASPRRAPAAEEEGCCGRRRAGCCVACEGGCEGGGRGVASGDSGVRTSGPRPRAGRAGESIL